MIKNNLVVGGVLLALVFSLFAVFNAPENVPVGGSAGPQVFTRQYFNAGYQSGGETYATSSTAATYTLLAAEFDQDVSLIQWNAGLNITLTTMASTSMDFLGNTAGDRREYDFYSATSTAATTITFAAGTGVDLQFGEATGGDLVLNGLDVAQLTFIRKANSDVIVIFDEYTEAD